MSGCTMNLEIPRIALSSNTTFVVNIEQSNTWRLLILDYQPAQRTYIAQDIQIQGAIYSWLRVFTNVPFGRPMCLSIGDYKAIVKRANLASLNKYQWQNNWHAARLLEFRFCHGPAWQSTSIHFRVSKLYWYCPFTATHVQIEGKCDYHAPAELRCLRRNLQWT